ncbi:hypothetical protein V8C86DRAFT_2499523 [Haematococcus lacustris]
MEATEADVEGTLAELCILRSSFDVCFQIEPEEVEALVDSMSRALDVSSGIAALAASRLPITCTAHLRCACPEQPGQPPGTLRLSVRLPWCYPLEPACALLAPCKPQRPACCQWVSQVTALVAELADTAAAQGERCLLEVMQLVCSSAEAPLPPGLAMRGSSGSPCSQQQQPQQQGPAPPAAAEPFGQAGSAGLTQVSQGGPGGVQAEGVEVLLLRLDHMHDPALYTRTVKAWCQELRLAGRLIIVAGASGPRARTALRSRPQLLLLLLLGPGPDLQRYLQRHRTQNVDVDSRGRKCRERMMAVVLQQPWGGAPGQAFTDFSVVQVERVSDAELLLAGQGISGATRAALGLGSP